MAYVGKILIMPKGTYDARVSYEILDMVNHRGKTWVAKKNVIGIEPSDANSEHWFHMAGHDGYVTPQMFGAKGDGATDDTEAIREAIKHGYVYFPRGTYNVQFTDLTTDYGLLFTLNSNTRLYFEKGATIKLVGGTPTARKGVFGVNADALPVENIEVIGGSFIGLGADVACFRFFSHSTGDKLINNIHIADCNFNNFASAVYIVQQKTVATETRHTHNVLIENCRAFECWASFVTGDGKHITIQNCHADGNNKDAYDAVSIHCGIDVTIKDNYFTNYNAGQVINIRNSDENGCGTKHVVVSGNVIEDCPIKAISLSLSTESTYGLVDVVVSNNIIKNCATGVFVSCGSAVSGTPFKHFNIENNVIHTTNSYGIAILNNTNVPLTESVVCGNNVNAEKYGIHCTAIYRTTVANNRVTMTSSESIETAKINYVYYSCIGGNMLWNANPTTATLTIANCTRMMFTNNFYRAKANFDANDNCMIENNLAMA